jgi:hypothetical protein
MVRLFHGPLLLGSNSPYKGELPGLKTFSLIGPATYQSSEADLKLSPVRDLTYLPAAAAPAFSQQILFSR